MIADHLTLLEIELLYKGLILSVIFITLYLGTLIIENKALKSKTKELERHNNRLLELLDLEEFPDGIDSYW